MDWELIWIAHCITLRASHVSIETKIVSESLRISVIKSPCRGWKAFRAWTCYWFRNRSFWNRVLTFLRVGRGSNLFLILIMFAMLLVFQFVLCQLSRFRLCVHSQSVCLIYLPQTFRKMYATSFKWKCIKTRSSIIARFQSRLEFSRITSRYWPCRMLWLFILIRRLFYHLLVSISDSSATPGSYLAQVLHLQGSFLAYSPCPYPRPTRLRASQMLVLRTRGKGPMSTLILLQSRLIFYRELYCDVCCFLEWL